MKLFQIGILLYTLLLGDWVLSQTENVVIGTVMTETKEPVAEAKVQILGTQTGAITDFDGSFSLSVPSLMDTLKISYIGYEQELIPINGQTNLTITLMKEIAVKELEGVIVTALGIKRSEKALSYSAQKVDGDDLNQAKDPNFVNNLSGKVAGVNVTSGSTGVGSSSLITIRGNSSLSGGNQPLFVVDGIPVDNNTTLNNTINTGGSETQEVDYGNGAGEINPDDIESVTVLKGPAAASLYGSRAANGVILITTKSGKNGKNGLGISFSQSTTFESPLRLPKYQNEFGQGKNGDFEYVDGLENSFGLFDEEDVSWGPTANGQLIGQFDSPIAGTELRAGDIFARGWYRDENGNVVSPGAITDQITPTPFSIDPKNVRDFFQTGITASSNVAISHKTEKSNMRISYTNLSAKGMIPNTNLLRHNMSVNLGHSLTDKLKVRLTGNYIHSQSKNRPNSGYGSESPMYMFTWYGRTVNTSSLEEYWQRGYEGLEQYNYNYAWHDNPYFTLYENTNGFNKGRLIGNITASYQFNKYWSLMFRSGIDTYNDHRESRRAFSTQRFKRGAYREDKVFYQENNSDFLLTFDKRFNDNFRLNMFVGGNQMTQKRSYSNIIANQLSAPGIYNFGNSAVPIVAEQFDANKTISSLYASTKFELYDGLYADLGVRNDWSSTLPSDEYSYLYPSAGASWVLSETYKLPKVFTFLKLRGTFAQVGNDTGPYQLVTAYDYGLPYNSVFQSLSQSTQLNNSTLRPERLTSYEGGVDVRFFDNRMGIDFTYYVIDSRDQILPVPVSNTSGYETRIINSGWVRNNGVELMLTTKNVEKKNFEWTTSFNFSKNVGTVKELAEGLDAFTYNFSSVYDGEGSVIWFNALEGERLGNMYGRKFARHEGQIIYENGDPVIDPEIQFLGNYNPDFMLGVANDFKLGNFNINFLWDWRQGGIFISRTKQVASYAGNFSGTEDRPEDGIVGEGVMWDEASGTYVTNNVAQDYRIYYRNHNNRNTQQETGILPATFLKLREVQIGYNLPKKWFKNTSITNFKLSIVGRNIVLITPKENPHFDPEAISVQGATLVPGIEDVAFPTARSIGFRVGFNF